jgi:hypothetical protein
MRTFFGILLLVCLAFAVRSSSQSVRVTKLYEFDDFTCESLKLRNYNLLQELQKLKGARAYIFVYEGKYRLRNEQKLRLPRNGEAQSRISLIKAHLKFLKGSNAPIHFVFGGYREHLSAEYFVVPAGAASPKPAPTLKRIKHTKGTPKKIIGGNDIDC